VRRRQGNGPHYGIRVDGSPLSNPPPFFTIVIPVKDVNGYVRETVSHIRGLKDPDWELIIVPNEDTPSEWNDSRIRLISSGRVGPAAKRDMAAKIAQGEILVFLDDDSFPREDLLTAARPFFSDTAVAAVGGPAITPPEDGFWQRVSGAMFLSRFSGGSPERYFPVGVVREVHDWPSVNLMIRKSDFLAVGGFDSPFWPGEDTKLCLEIVKTGKKILYVPQAVVWHHRRPGFFAHLRQVGAYGLHRGFFAKRFPETSLKLAYFAPSAMVLFILVSVAGMVLGIPVTLKDLLLAGWALYGAALFVAFVQIVRFTGVWVACCAVPFTVGTHVVYGLQFLRGLVLERNLVSRLR